MESIVVHLAPDYVLPADPRALRAHFLWSEVEDDSGRTPARVTDNPNLVGMFPLETTLVGDGAVLALRGSRHPLEHPVGSAPVTGHPHGITFQVVCRNRRKEVANATLWKRSLTNTDLAAMIGEVDWDELDNTSVVDIAGFMPAVPTHLQSLSITARITLQQQRRAVRMVAMELNMTRADYDAWIAAVSDGE